MSRSGRESVLELGAAQMAAMEALHFDNSSLRKLAVLPAAHEGDVTEPREKVPGAIFSRAKPTPLDQPELVIASSSALGSPAAYAPWTR